MKKQTTLLTVSALAIGISYACGVSANPTNKFNFGGSQHNDVTSSATANAYGGSAGSGGDADGGEASGSSNSTSGNSNSSDQANSNAVDSDQSNTNSTTQLAPSDNQ